MPRKIPTLLPLLLCLVAFSSLASAQCTPTGTAPSVTICQPTGPSVSTTFHVSAAALDNGTVNAMKIYLDGTSVFQTSGASVETDLTVTAGNHTMTVKAWDSAGAVFSKSMAISASASTTTGGGTGGGTTGAPCTMSSTDPSVTICTPADGAAVTTEFEVVAGTTDSAATVGTMKIYIDGTAQYTFHDTHIDTDVIVTAGPHKMTVKAWDSAGRVFSKSINITASDSGTSGGGGTTPPPGNCAPSSADNSVNVCSPTNGSTVTSPVSVTAAANSSSGVKTMKIYLDGTAVFTVNASTINTSINASTGTHKITVKAWNQSNVSFSSSLNFTVSSTTGGGGGGTTPPPPTGPISPARIALTFGQQQQFTSSGATSWSVDGTVGGSTTTGTIDQNGLYTAPSAAGTHTITATGSQTATANAYVMNESVLTFHNDSGRRGLNDNEIALTKSNVKQSTFGKLARIPLDADSHGEPLYIPNLTINGATHNVVFIATEHDSVYAFDADGKSTTPLWHVNFTNSGAGITTMPASDTGTTCCIAPEVGITSTPAVDTSTHTMYVVAATKENGAYVNRLHALDYLTGQERSGSPVKITAAVKGNAPERDSSGIVHLNPLRNLQRSALLFVNGRVYIPYSSFNDIRPYHGWLLAYDAATLQQVGVWCATPNNWGGGLWQSGNGAAADSAGNIYIGTGNGSYSASSGGPDCAESIMKFDSNLNVADYFTPNAWSTYNSQDQDIGSGGVVLFPGDSLAVNVNKASVMYLLNTGSLGHLGTSGDPQIPQELKSVIGVTRDAPAIFNSTFYVASLDDNLKAFKLSNGKFQTTPVAQTTLAYPFPGASPSISSNGTSDGIVWALRHSGGNAILYAFDANTLTELYDSSQAGSRDTGPISVRFATPMIVNGRVYVAGKDALVIYGLLP